MTLRMTIFGAGLAALVLVTGVTGSRADDMRGGDMAGNDVLDPALLELVETMDAAHGARAERAPVAVLVAVDPERRDATVSEMRALGVSVGTVAGDVVSGRIDPAAIVPVSELPGVVKMELSRPLSPEDSGQIDYRE